MKLPEITAYHLYSFFWFFVFIIVVLGVILGIMAIVEYFKLSDKEKDQVVKDLFEEGKKEMIEIKSISVSPEKYAELEKKSEKYDKLKSKYKKLKKKYNALEKNHEIASNYITFLIKKSKENEEKREQFIVRDFED